MFLRDACAWGLRGCVTKHRRGVFTKEVIDGLRTIFTGVCLDFGAELSAFDGEHDHVHRLVNDPPKVSVSVLINTLKGVSSRMIGQKQYPSVSKKRWDTQSTIAPSCGGSDSDHRPIHRATANTRITNKQDTFGVRAIHPPP